MFDSPASWVLPPLTLRNWCAADLMGLAYPDYGWGMVYANGF